MKYPFHLSDVRFEAFRRGSGPGGQHKNKTATSIRAIHEPTGVIVTCCNERSQKANKDAATTLLQAKLNRMVEDRVLDARRAAHQSKPDAAFGAQIRTYRLCGNAQGVVDHRTNISHPSTHAVLRGDLDGLLRAAMFAESGRGVPPRSLTK